MNLNGPEMDSKLTTYIVPFVFNQFLSIFRMRNPNNLPQVTIQKFIDMQPPHNLIDEVPKRDESVEAKWEQIQYYEAKENYSLNSLASSSTTSTSSSGSGSNPDKLKSRLQKLKRNGLKKLANFKLWSKNDAQEEKNNGRG